MKLRKVLKKKSTPANDFEKDLALLVRKYLGPMANKGKNLNGRSFRIRKCYNCDNPRHFVVEPMRDVKTSPRSLCSGIRNFQNSPRGRMTRLLFTGNTCPGMKMMVMMIMWAWPLLSCI